MKAILLSTLFFAQHDSLPVILPRPTDGEKRFTTEVYKDLLKEESLLKKMSGKSLASEPNILSEQEKKWLMERHNLAVEDQEEIDYLPLPFSLEPYGCSWHCGGGAYNVTASSSLPSNGKTNYSSDAANDWDLRTAWVEGVNGDGIGESITYRFQNESPRVTSLLINNGYVKTDRTWNENNRVKEFEVLVNQKPYAILQLEDTWKEQVFILPDTLGHFEQGTQIEHNSDEKFRYWTLTLKIRSVYPGDKYRDTAISEIDFDGVDVHCLAAGTLISQPGGKETPIENLKKGDKVSSFNKDGETLSEVTVKSIHKALYYNLVRLTAAGKELTLTKDHPLATSERGWCNAEESGYSTHPVFGTMEAYRIGETIPFINERIGQTNIETIEPIEVPGYAYWIELEQGNNVIANGFVVGAE